MKYSGHYKEFVLYVPVLFLLFLGVWHAFFYFDRKSEEKEVATYREVTRLSREDLSLLQEGDFILRRGFGFFSDMIARQLNDSYIDVTHAGILVKKDNRWHVIHSLSSDVTPEDGMQIQDLNTFLHYSRPGKIIITRAKNATLEDNLMIVERAYHYLDRQIPFDHKGNFEEDDKLYCSELIWRILEKDLHLLALPQEAEPRQKLFYSMTGLYDEEYFDIIINQFADSEKQISTN
ncbi:MAG TPA: YiiX/YebB-like N1pC/P60 family cysteine hydrolase [Flavobacteriaceae bacterium]|nr:YiiX/YebB-like N1pC/P60 family cysteine hydrolase [Flavobacteriaceae bacterium]